MQAEILVRDAPGEIVQAIVADAEGRDVTFQEAAVAVLCADFKVEHSPSGRKFVAGTVGGSHMHLEVPVELRQRIRRRAFDQGTIRGVVLAALAKHYGLPAVDPGRRARGE